jgi:hypothetical protein
MNMLDHIITEKILWQTRDFLNKQVNAVGTLKPEQSAYLSVLVARELLVVSLGTHCAHQKDTLIVEEMLEWIKANTLELVKRVYSNQGKSRVGAT